MKSSAQHAGSVSGKGRQAARAAFACISILTAGLLNTAPADAQTYTETLLHSFTGPEGIEPSGTLLAAATGDFYGSASGGAFGNGEIYKISKTGAQTVFYSFGPPPDGSSPGSVIQGVAGNLYGVTASGGTYGHGTIFKLDPEGKETVLYNFTGGLDGSEPDSSLVRDAAGNLYGTTSGGGTSDLGTVYKLSAAGVEGVLHSFTGPPDGDYPTGGLLRDSAGNLYGTTFFGGAPPNCSEGCGTIYEVTPGGEAIVLYNFTGESDGQWPAGGVIMDSAGNLYGTASNGGYLYGTVFKLSPRDKLTVLYTFLGDGEFPEAGLIRDSAGNLYGTTWMGGTGPCYNGFYDSGCGTVFEISASGTESVLHAFAGPPDGEYAVCTLVRDAAGNLYGTTYGGGDAGCNPPYGCGVAFELKPQLR